MAASRRIKPAGTPEASGARNAQKSLHALECALAVGLFPYQAIRFDQRLRPERIPPVDRPFRRRAEADRCSGVMASRYTQRCNLESAGASARWGSFATGRAPISPRNGGTLSKISAGETQTTRPQGTGYKRRTPKRITPRPGLGRKRFSVRLDFFCGIQQRIVGFLERPSASGLWRFVQTKALGPRKYSGGHREISYPGR